jgi:hypothetical protein
VEGKIWTSLKRKKKNGFRETEVIDDPARGKE